MEVVKSDLVDIMVSVIKQTERAVLIDDGECRSWLPLSQIEIAPFGDGKHHEVTMPEWLAKEKGLI